MKKTSVLSVIFLVCATSLVAGQDVAEVELLSVRDTAVEFINYEGPHAKIETLEEIMGVGIFLGNAIGDGYSTAEYAAKYRVIHAVGDSADEGLEADIFMVLKDAEVDHIRNMRYMLAGFLIAAYGYEREDALLLAEFVTIYNAVYRGKMDFLGGKYKMIVTRNLDPKAAGISTIYTDWPGGTEMVIPLTEIAAEGGIGSLDTDVLTEKEVIEEMRTQPERGLESRKDITELKEREVEQEQAKIEEERTQLQEEEQRIAAAQERIEEERTQVARERETAESAADKARADEREEALAREEQQLEAEAEELAERETQLIAREREQTERIEQIQTEREQIAADERELMDQEAGRDETAIAAAASGRSTVREAVYLEIRELGGEPLGRLIHIDTATGSITGASTLNSIRNRSVESLGPYYAVVAGTTLGQGAVRLMTVQKDTLATGHEGSDDIYPGSALVVDGASLYAVAGEGGTWNVAKFDSTLTVQAVSKIEVYPDTALTVVDSILYVAGADGAVHALLTADLTDSQTVR
ncbi:MAG: hypothetical protein JW852_12425 [Spirochaetales bacterium]|nr:hypothetical protein [Spirochaetales bacterium]